MELKRSGDVGRYSCVFVDPVSRSFRELVGRKGPKTKAAAMRIVGVCAVVARAR